MRCDKCGSEIDSQFNICPVCGNIFIAGETSDEIQGEIGTKIERILGDSEITGLDDGVGMAGGRMDASAGKNVSDTQEFKVPDTVFKNIPEEERAQAMRRQALKRKEIDDQYHWDSSDWEDLDDEAMLEKLMNDGSGEKSGSDGSGRAAGNAHTGSSPAGGGSFAKQNVSQRSYRAAGSDVAEDDDLLMERESVRTDNHSRQRPSKKEKSSGTGSGSSKSSRNSSSRKKNPRIREAKKAPGRSHAGLIIGIIAAVCVIAAICVILYTGVYRNWAFWNHAEETERTTVADELTCNVSEGGVYALPLDITIESAAGNRVYYTLDGSDPANNSLKYNGPISISADYATWTEAPYTLKAVSYTETSIKAAELTVNFTVRKPDISAPVFSLPGGTYDSAQGITITAEKGATIYYTYDEWGTLPTTESAVYRGTIEMLGGTKILSAIAVNGDRISEVAQVTYTLSLAINYSYNDAYYKIAAKVENEGYAVSDTEPTTTTTEETTTAPPETTKKAEDPTKEGETTTAPETTAPATTAPTEAPKITTAVLYNSGTVDIGGANYYVIWVQLYYNNGERADGMYYGVDSSSGAIVRMSNNGGYFSIY